MRWLKHALIGAAVIVAAAVTSAAVFGATGKSAPHHGLAVAKDNKNKVKGKVQQGTLRVAGTNDDESIVLRLRDPSTLDLVVDGTSIDDFKRSDFNQIEVGAGGGDDVVAIDESNGAFTDTEATSLDGEGGNDRLVGGSFSETLIGGDGNDTIDGNRGSDVAFLGAGDDSFVWDPGDGSDTVEGQAGSDTMVFNGSNAGEGIDLSANGQRLRLTRDVGSITMDTAGVETVDVNALGGIDTLTINDLSGSDVTNVKTDLSSNGAGDGQPDQVIVNGTAGNDAITVTGSAGAATVTGLPATVQIAGAEPLRTRWRSTRSWATTLSMRRASQRMRSS